MSKSKKLAEKAEKVKVDMSLQDPEVGVVDPGAKEPKKDEDSAPSK